MDPIQARIDAAVNTVRRELIEQFNATVLTLQNQSNQALDRIAESLNSRSHMNLPPHTNQRPKPVLPDPEKFASVPYKFNTWLPAIKAKLRVDNEAIGDSIAQFYYVYLNLDSSI
jgi:hypothetical protein